MTIASLIVSVGADVSKLQTDVEKIHGTLDKVTKVAGVVGTALAGAFAVNQIISYGKQVIDFAGQLTDLSQKTGISTTGLQKLQLAFEQSGVSLDTVTRSVGELGARLVGDKGAQAMVEKLGLNLADLKRMSPEEQFMKVADAVGNIQNKGEQLYASKTLFGKGGMELLQGLDGHLKETTDHFEDMGLIMSEQTVKAADDFGDKLGLLGKQGLALIASVLGPFLPLLSALADNLMTVGQILSKILGPAIEWLMKQWMTLGAAMNRFIANVLDAAQKIPMLGEHLGIAAQGAEFFRNQADKLDAQLANLSNTTDTVTTTATRAAAPLIGLGDHIERVGRKAEFTTAELARMQAQTRLFDQSARAVELFYATVAQDMALQDAKAHIAELVEPIDDMEAAFARADQSIQSFYAVLGQDMVLQNVKVHVAEVDDSFGDLVRGINTGSGMIADGISGVQGVFDQFHNKARTVTSDLVGYFGGMAQATNGVLRVMQGDMRGWVDIVIGSFQQVMSFIDLLKKAWHGIAGLFQSEETKKVNSPRDSFFAQFGGFDGLANELTQSLIAQGVAESGNIASGLIKTLNDADTEAKFHSAEQSIADVFSAGGRQIQMMAAGGTGVVTRPTLFMAGEAGREEYAFSGANRRLDRSGGDDAGLRGMLARTQETLTRIDRSLREQGSIIGDAVKTAVVYAR
jgi:hypothetical protein